MEIYKQSEIFNVKTEILVQFREIIFYYTL